MATPLYITAYFFVSVYKRPAMGYRPNLASRSEVVPIYKCPQKFWGPLPQILDTKNI